MKKEFLEKSLIMVVSIFLMGLALSFLMKVNWGLDPGSFMVRSVALFTGLSFGLASIIIYGAMLLIMVIFSRDLLGVGTLVNMTMVGLSADFFSWVESFIINPIVFSDERFIVLKTTIFILSIALFIIAAAVYMKCQVGISPYDAMPLIIQKRFFPRAPFPPVRMSYDCLIVIIGVLFCIYRNPALLKSLPVAVIMVFSVGPAITLVGSFMEKHFGLFR